MPKGCFSEAKGIKKNLIKREAKPHLVFNLLNIFDATCLPLVSLTLHTPGHLLSLLNHSTVPGLTSILYPCPGLSPCTTTARTCCLSIGEELPLGVVAQRHQS